MACNTTVEIPSGGVAEIPDLTCELAAVDNRTPRHLLIIEQDPPSGTLVGPGTYLITVTITDQAGNQTVCTSTFCVEIDEDDTDTIFYNTPQSATALCPVGTTGAAQTVTIPARTFSSTISQATADALAAAEAATQANALLCCCPECGICPECPPEGYPYGYGYDNCYGLYEDCYPYGYGCYPPPTIPSYVINHWWKMDECGTAIRRDSIGTSDLSPSVISGSIGCVPGVVGNASAASGSNVNLQVTSTELIYFNNGMTLFGWVRMDRDFANAATILIDYELVFGGPADRLRIMGNYPNNLTDPVTWTITEDVTDDPVVSGVFPNCWNDWLFFIATHNGASGSLTLEIKTVTNHMIITSSTNWTPAAHTTGRIFFYGSPNTRRYDECGIIYRILTEAEKNYLWNGGAGRSWPFA